MKSGSLSKVTVTVRFDGTASVRMPGSLGIKQRIAALQLAIEAATYAIEREIDRLAEGLPGIALRPGSLPRKREIDRLAEGLPGIALRPGSLPRKPH